MLEMSRPNSFEARQTYDDARRRGHRNALDLGGLLPPPLRDGPHGPRILDFVRRLRVALHLQPTARLAELLLLAHIPRGRAVGCEAEPEHVVRVVVLFVCRPAVQRAACARVLAELVLWERCERARARAWAGRDANAWGGDGGGRGDVSAQLVRKEERARRGKKRASGRVERKKEKKIDTHRSTGKALHLVDLHIVDFRRAPREQNSEEVHARAVLGLDGRRHGAALAARAPGQE